MDFDEFAREARKTKILPPDLTPEQRQHLLAFGLLAQTGDVARELKKRLRDAEDYEKLVDELEVSLGHVLWYLCLLSEEFNINLENLAERNLRYNAARWRFEEEQSELVRLDFDDHFPSDQKFPRKFWASFSDRLENGVTKTSVTIHLNWPSADDGIPFGDEIDDNSAREDHYRYHDVFHLAYAAVLGWSPVIRKLLSIKRKAETNTDRIEDGARARDLEEATTAFIYKIAAASRFFSKGFAVDTSVLDIVMVLVADLEVSSRDRSEWEEAIITACSMQRRLIKNKGGVVEVDMDKRKLIYLEIKSEENPDV